MKTLATLTSATILMALVACGSNEAEAPAAPAADAPTEAPATPDLPDIDAAALALGADNVALVPSPIETQNALESAGITTQLASLIPEHKFDMEKSDTDHAAIRTGVVLADALLTVKTAEKDALLSRLDSITKGMQQLGGGEDIAKMLADMTDRVKSDAVSRDELLQEFEDLSGAAIPELEFNGNVRVVPLIQAGSWLEGANLVAQAVKNTDDVSAADTLLKQPAVVDYFATYVRTEGAEKAPEQVTKKLGESLDILKGLASKADPLNKEDLDSVITVTSDVLGLL